MLDDRGADAGGSGGLQEAVAALAGAAVLVHPRAEEDEVAAALADQVWIVDKGRVAVSGTVADLTVDASLEDVFEILTESIVNNRWFPHEGKLCIPQDAT